jgi:hypothetical protein
MRSCAARMTSENLAHDTQPGRSALAGAGFGRELLAGNV